MRHVGRFGAPRQTSVRHVVAAPVRLAAGCGQLLRLVVLGVPIRPARQRDPNAAPSVAAQGEQRAAGVIIGRDASVIAYDDINASAYFFPPLTTFLYPLETLSRVLAQFMLRLLEGEAPAALTHFVRPELIIRQDDCLHP